MRLFCGNSSKYSSDSIYTEAEESQSSQSKFGAQSQRSTTSIFPQDFIFRKVTITSELILSFTSFIPNSTGSRDKCLNASDIILSEELSLNKSYLYIS